MAVLWPLVDKLGSRITFAYEPFKWSNLAAKNAGISVIVVGLSTNREISAKLFAVDGDETSMRSVPHINGYLLPRPDNYVQKVREPISDLTEMSFGNHPYYAAQLLMTLSEAEDIIAEAPEAARFFRPIYGSTEVIKGLPRICLWLGDADVRVAEQVKSISKRLESVRRDRAAKKSDKTAQILKDYPHRFRDRRIAQNNFIAVPQTSSEEREYLPCDLMSSRALVTFKCFALYDASLWNMALVVSKLHLTWIGAVCGRLEMRFSYSNTLGWNTFPVPRLTAKNQADLTRCAEDIMLARERHFPANIADLYDPEHMPDDLHAAHERNDEVLERIYIGRRFKNDTERLEKLFDLYTKMTESAATEKKRKTRANS